MTEHDTKVFHDKTEPEAQKIPVVFYYTRGLEEEGASVTRKKNGKLTEYTIKFAVLNESMKIKM